MPSIIEEMNRIARYDSRVIAEAFRRATQLANQLGRQQSSLPDDVMLNITRDVRNEFDRDRRLKPPP